MKTRSRRGFTLVETLVTLLVVAVMGVGLVAGISAATGVYRRSLFLSESQLLSSTLDTALSDVLRYSKFEEIDGDGVLHLSNDTSHSIHNGSLLAYRGRLRINPTDAPVGDGTSLSHLVGESSYSGISVTAFSLTYQTGVFSGSYTLSNGDGSLSATLPFTFRTLVE